MLTNRQRLIECITCLYCETCEYTDKNADALEDENGHCTKHVLDSSLIKEQKD